MHCPVCGQQQLAENIRFCSRCGFLLTGIAEIVANNGVIPQQIFSPDGERKESPRKRGLKQGLMILLVGCFLVVPLLAMFHLITNTDPFLVAVASILSFCGGILRMIYAMMFESKLPGGKTLEQNLLSATHNVLGKKQSQPALMPQQSIPVNDYVPPKAGNWRQTNDLIEVGSVTENTTKLLDKEEPNQ